jgi:hypothetical protein
MNKYSSLYKDVYSIFGAIGWMTEGIKTVPENFVGSSIGNTYVRVAIVASGQTVVNPPRSVAGQLMIDIFIPAGGGSNETTRIADKLDDYLAGKTIKTNDGGSTQLGYSNLVSMGNDKANPSLYRSSYSIPFNYYGI